MKVILKEEWLLDKCGDCELSNYDPREEDTLFGKRITPTHKFHNSCQCLPLTLDFSH